MYANISEVVRCTSIHNGFKVKNNWHLMPNFNYIGVNINLQLNVHCGDFIIVGWLMHERKI